MNSASLQNLVRTLLIGGIGGTLFTWLGFPVAGLTGAAVASAAASLAGLRIDLPTWFRNLCFLALGISIGASVTPEVLRGALDWPLSLAILALALVLSMLLCRLILMRGFGLSHDTAVLASAPGHLSYVLSMAVEGRGDARAVSLVQSIRVLFLTLIVPPLLITIYGLAPEPPPAPVIRLLPCLGLFAASAALGLFFLRLGLPAAYLLAGMAISAVGQLSQIAPGTLPNPLLFVAMIALGTLIGSRFNGVSLAELKRFLFAGILMTTTTLLAATLGALTVTLFQHQPLDLLIAGFAPGGVEAMAAIAVELGIDPTFVAAHHVTRLLLLTFLVPFVLGRPQRP